MWSIIRNENINYIWDKISYSSLKKCDFQRYKLENADLKAKWAKDSLPGFRIFTQMWSITSNENIKYVWD